MKRRQRKPILDLNGEQADSTRRRWHNKYEQIADEHAEQNGSSKNPLFNLVGQYDSDSETDDKQVSTNVLNDKVDDFLKEIQAIKPEKISSSEQQCETNKNHNFNNYKQIVKSAWQECFDETTGYPYYWHMETNEVTWEIPEELRMKKGIIQNDAISHNQFMHWSTSSAKNYSQMQNNIPDGMIPKEVVARNRNRQIGNQQKVVQERQAVSIKESQKDDDSDDGKIEMITSFGNDETDSEDTSDESATKSPEKFNRRKEKTKSKKNANSPSRKEFVQMGPSLPDGIVAMMHGPENISLSQNRRRSTINDSDRNNAVPLEDPAKEVATKSSRIQSESSHNKSENESQSSSDVKRSLKRQTSRMKVSLVPGYEDDSDNEEEKQNSAEGKPLFPISNYYEDHENANKVSKSEIICNEKLVKKVETRQTESGCIRIFEYHPSDGISETKDSSTIQLNEANDDSKSEGDELKTEQDVKTNTFLDEINDAPSKAFQRKKRIAFDVIPNKAKQESPQENAEVMTPSYTMAYENEEKYGLGFQDKSSDDSNKSSKEATPSATTKNTSGITFVKGETMHTQKEDPTPMSEAKKLEFKTLTDTTIEKLKFLSEGSPPASAVQIMAIQLQTLLSAWESKDLKEKYLCDWLTETSRELSRLEQTAAPHGWKCQWDRSHKRYFYRNLSSGEVQWTYPETDVVGGTEEMELCTTPPPEQEEPSVIELNNSNMEQSVIQTPEESQTKETEVPPKPISAPPPPQISSPSPPPPPRICAEDLKRGKKRKEEQEKTYDNKKEKLDQDEIANTQQASASKSSETQLSNQPSKAATLPTTEPLPPGVDSSDMTYTLPNSAIDSTVLYTAASQQTNPIYAATLGNAAVPILAHHTALMQGQLMHYPAYHPLHNQMIMATANRLTEPDTIQFMVADYSRIYENNQVIAKPPVKTTQRESICSAIDSFYNDIASIEQNNKTERDMSKKCLVESVPSSTVQVQQTEAEKSPISVDPNLKEKKKKKPKVGISKKQKEVSSMVAKWQKVQKNFVD